MNEKKIYRQGRSEIFTQRNIAEYRAVMKFLLLNNKNTAEVHDFFLRTCWDDATSFWFTIVLMNKGVKGTIWKMNTPQGGRFQL